MRLLFLLVLSGLLLTNTLKSQIADYKEFYMGGGYNVSYGTFSELNYILDKFNQEAVRTKDFKDIHAPNGFCLALGANLSSLNFEFGVASKKQRRSADYIVGDDTYQYDVTLNMVSYSFGTGFFFPVSDAVGIGLGAAYEFGTLKLQTRESLRNNIGRKDYLDIVKDKTQGITIDFKFQLGDMNDDGSKLLIKPYYTLLLNPRTNLAPLDAAVNPGSTTDPSDLNQNFSHFGIKFIVTYSVVR